jgi:Ca2+-transporting ATPase
MDCLSLAVAWELTLMLLIVYVPVLHRPFGTYDLNFADWILLVGLAFTIVPVLELGKWMVRRGWLGPLD